MSLPEVLLWKELQGGRLTGLHFRKQHPIGRFVLDFYCAAAKLAVEVDGRSHETEDRPHRDAARDLWLAARGISTLRLAAADVLRSPHDAARMVLARIQDR